MCSFCLFRLLHLRNAIKRPRVAADAPPLPTPIRVRYQSEIHPTPRQDHCRSPLFRPDGWMDSKHAFALPAHKIRGRSCLFLVRPLFYPRESAAHIMPVTTDADTDSQALPSSIEHQLCCCTEHGGGKVAPAVTANVIRSSFGRAASFRFPRFWTLEMFVLFHFQLPGNTALRLRMKYTVLGDFGDSLAALSFLTLFA